MSSTLTRAEPTAPTGSDEVGHVSPPPREPVLLGAGPWRRPESVVAAFIAAIGIVGLVLTWHSAAGERYWREQLDLISVATFCTLLVVLAVVGWIVVGMRRLRRGFRELAARKDRVFGLNDLAEDDDPSELDGSLVRLPAMNRVHRPGCLLLRGKTPVVVPAEQVGSFDRCGVCRS